MFSDAIANSGGGGGGFFSSLGNMFSGSGGSSGFSSFLPGLLSAFGASALTPNAPGVPQLPNQGPAATNLYGDISGLNNPYSTLQPYEFSNMLGYLNNPYVSQYMNAAKNAGAASTAAGKASTAGAGLLTQDANSIYQSSFDPQSVLYSQLKQQNQDQNNVTNAQYGLTTSPYGAGVANQSANNFNIDWQNQQLQRQIAGSGAMNADLSGAAALRQGGIQDYLGGGALPYGTYTGMLGDQNSALNQYMTQAGAGNQMTQGAIGDWLSYLTGGNQSAGTNLAAYNAQLNANNQTAAGLYPIFSSMFNSGGSSGGYP